ncbi:MAG: MFS transporter [Ilumatobacteraceae bacterium]
MSIASTTFDEAAAEPHGVDDTSRTVLWRGARLRRFLLLHGAGQTADAMVTLALAQVIVFQIEQGASPATVVRVLCTAMVPYLVAGPIAGVIADRWPRRRSLAATSTVRAVLVLLAVSVPETGSRVLGYAVAAAVLGAAGTAMNLRSASLPHLVPERSLVAANSMSSIVQKVAGTVGFVLSTVVSLWSPVAVLFVASLIHAFAALGYARFGAEFGGGEQSERRSSAHWPQVVRRLIRLASVPPTRGVICAAIAHRALAASAFVGFILLADSRYELEASGFAVAIGITATGAFIGTLAASFLVALLGRRVLILLCFLGCAAAMGSAAWSGESVVVMGAMIVVSFTVQVVRLVTDATVQGHVVDDSLGRVFAGYDAIYNLAYIAGAVVGVVVIAPGHTAGFGYIAVGWMAAALIPLLGSGRSRPWRVA